MPSIILLLISVAILSYLWLQQETQTPRPRAILQPGTLDQAVNTTTASVLLVSAYFPLSIAPRSSSKYLSRIKLFLASVTTDVYFYTTPAYSSFFSELRGDLPLTINASFSSPFSIPPLQGLESTLENQLALDRTKQRQRHSPELYAVFASKPYLLEQAVISSGKTYDYVFWVDAGSFNQRNHAYGRWPDPARVESIFRDGVVATGRNLEELFFVPTGRPPHGSMKWWNDGMGTVISDFTEPSYFGGSPRAIAWWSALFYRYHAHYRLQGVFVGLDQPLINALVLMHADRVITVWHGDPSPEGGDDSLTDATCGPPWYYYQWYFASDEDRAAMSQMWDWQRWWRWLWPAERCRATSLASMQSLLKRFFGKGWTPPRSRLSVE
ncbi:hypothetical protein PUNSTDRAFT_72156 [Punctularia strigosozonata HHB-11173 SS5]|uniref:uncharacterized protein n=1 Tax=Punctularia strigosozonata (strain HHB-11173) TaxID=741275 RepID=UPI0004416B9B|nr:uncharacterized protein PUNSTDRAFT_72156 [Punctularia strigosozonata HHB-11173 SS5]EIN06430.1 hypothetical protein PUNSTDRAFT_72156 [Punctularia strigosozonata HHB-11173 SS5]